MQIRELLEHWVSDLVFRLIILTKGQKDILSFCRGHAFMWDGWRDDEGNPGVIQKRRLRTPYWYLRSFYENDATTTDGYGYRFFEIEEKRYDPQA